MIAMDTRPRHIAHLDLDCFFVSVERITNPALRGKPVVVGGSPKGRGVVASASYEARAFGVHSAMPTGRALRLCPQLVVVHGHHERYSDYSDRITDRLRTLVPVVERASIDEMYLDLTGCETLYHNDLPGFIRGLQKIVLTEFDLPCTIALASNKTLAKIATGTVKPAGICVVPHGTERAFLAPLPIDVIPGVGPKTEEMLKRRGFTVIADLQRAGQARLLGLLGKHGSWLHEVATGGGSETVDETWVRKSISREETFAEDISDVPKLERILFSLVEDVCSSTRRKRWKAKTISLKLRYASFKTITRAETIAPTNDDRVVFGTVKELLRRNYTGQEAVRLLGVHLSQFVDDTELELPLYPSDAKRDQILDTIERLRDKFGSDVIHLGNA